MSDQSDKQHKSEDNQILIQKSGSGALSGKMLLVRIIVNNKIYIYFKAG